MAGKRPLASAAHFRVEWGAPDGSQAFARVEFAPIGAKAGELRLTRAVDGSTALIDWLQNAPAKEKAGRSVQVIACDTTGQPVATYRLEGCRPLSLTLSPMDARESGLLTETLSLAYARIDMSR